MSVVETLSREDEKSSVPKKRMVWCRKSWWIRSEDGTELETRPGCSAVLRRQLPEQFERALQSS